MAYKHYSDELAYQRKWQAANRKKCRAYCRKWRNANLENERQRAREWINTHPEYVKQYRKDHMQQARDSVNISAARPEAKLRRETKRLWDMYRITPEEQQQIRQFQENHALYQLVLGKNEGTDHSHKTGLIRGLMDWRINMAYGLLEKTRPNDLPALLRALALYHEQPPATLALGAPRFGLIGMAKYKKKMIYGSIDGPLPFEAQGRAARRKKKR